MPLLGAAFCLLIRRRRVRNSPFRTRFLQSDWPAVKTYSANKKVTGSIDPKKNVESYEKIDIFSPKQLMMINQLKFQRTKLFCQRCCSWQLQIQLPAAAFFHLFSPPSPYSLRQKSRKIRDFLISDFSQYASTAALNIDHPHTWVRWTRHLTQEVAQRHQEPALQHQEPAPPIIIKKPDPEPA